MAKDSKNKDKKDSAEKAKHIVEAAELDDGDGGDFDYIDAEEPFYKRFWRQLPDHQGWLADLKICVGVLTRIPVPPSSLPEDLSVSGASRYFPLVGGAIGLLGGIAVMLAAWLSFSPIVTSVFGLLAMTLVTGALHEDGLADTIDGLGGGSTRERRLAIMHDSQIGCFGVVALIFNFALKWAALTTIVGISVGDAVFALIATAAASRAVLPVVMHYVPIAREDGLSADAGRPGFDRATVAFLIGSAFLIFCLGFQTGIVSLVLGAAVAAMFIYFVANRIGGQTGDVLGATQQITEGVVLLTIVMVKV